MFRFIRAIKERRKLKARDPLLWKACYGKAAERQAALQIMFNSEKVVNDLWKALLEAKDESLN